MNSKNAELDLISRIALPKGWIRTTLSDNNYFKILSSGIEEFEGEKKYLSTSSIQVDQLVKVQSIINIDNRPSRANMQPIKNSVWFAKMKNTVKVLIASDEITSNYILSTGFCGILPNNINPEYLKWYFMSFWFNSEKDMKSTGATQMAINKTNIATINIQFPKSVLYQKRIVEKIEDYFTRVDHGISGLQQTKFYLRQLRHSILKEAVDGSLTQKWRKRNITNLPNASSELDRILEDRKRNWELEKLEQYKKKGHMPEGNKWKQRYKEPYNIIANETITLPDGWAWATIDQISEKVRYGTSAKCSSDPKGVPILAMGNIINGELSSENLKYLPENHDEFPDLILIKGDILFNRTNSPELVGKTALFRNFTEKCSFASYLIQLRVSKRIKPELIVYYINSFYGKQWIKSVVIQQTGQANVNGTKLKQLTFPLPSFEEQKKIVENVDRYLSLLKEKERSVLKTLKLAKFLRHSILKKAFEGKLVYDLEDNINNSFLKEDELKTENSERNKSKISKQITLDKWK